MSEQPTIPPPAYASYPRAGFTETMYGTSEKLRRLYRGYHGMSYTFLLGVLCYISALAVGAVIQQPGYETIGWVLVIFPAASFFAMYYLSIRSVRDVGYGNGWADALGILLGLIVPFMCLILCAVFGYLASSEMKKYGIVTRSFKGIDKVQVKDTIARLAEMEQASQPTQA